MPTTKAVVAEELKQKGFGAEITDEGVIAHLSNRKPSRHEIVDAIPELEGLPMEAVEKGVLISAQKEKFPV